MSVLKKGFVQIYTGNGKGKTTAAIGQAVRAAGSGLKTYIVQFMKEYPYSELKSLYYLNKWITIEQCGGDDFVYKKRLPSKKEISKIENGLSKAKRIMLSGNFDIIILDEILVSIYFKLIDKKNVGEFIKAKPEKIELILTGRYAPQSIINLADLVTEMREVKHYYTNGIEARKGIES